MLELDQLFFEDFSSYSNEQLETMLSEMSRKADEECHNIGIDYNIHDTTLIDMLEEKLKYIELVLTFAYDAKVNYADTLTTVRPWDIIIHNYLLDRCIVIPQTKHIFMTESLVGGFVKEPKIGLTKWVVSFDLDSLYSHLIMQYNISPETYIERIDNFPGIETLLEGREFGRENIDYSFAANGTVYRKDKQGFLPALLEKMYNDRVLYKNKMKDAKQSLSDLGSNALEADKKRIGNEIAKYHNLQLAKKTQLNAVYGALANEWFRWFDFNLAEAITMSGQLSIRWIDKKMNEYMNKLCNTTDTDYIIASDTDSIYVNMEPLILLTGETDRDKIVDMIDKFCETKIKGVIKKSYIELAEHMNAYQQKMSMKRETIADKGIWKAKKMYILNALDIEGLRFTKPELKIQGIEAVRSSTPKACRKNIKTVLELVMNTDELTVQKFIADFKSEFFTLPFENVAFPRGMNNIDKYSDRNDVFTKGTPIHVRGALVYNNFLKKNKLNKKYQNINDGDKIKFCYMKLPNPLHSNVIAILDDLPEELDMQKYIDYDLQFSKSFLEPIKSILNIINWDIERRNTLELFFS